MDNSNIAIIRLNDKSFGRSSRVAGKAVNTTSAPPALETFTSASRRESLTRRQTGAGKPPPDCPSGRAPHRPAAGAVPFVPISARPANHPGEEWTSYKHHTTSHGT